MQTWIHFTEDVFDALEAIEDDSPESFTDEGLFVYKWHSDFPEAERSAAWGGRMALLINCPEHLVELIQEDPLGDNPDNDEYMIPIDAFAECSIIN